MTFLYVQEGRTIVENKTADIIHETRKLNIRRKESGANLESQTAANFTQQNLPRTRTDYETQLKASRDVRWQMCIIGLLYSVFHILVFFI